MAKVGNLDLKVGEVSDFEVGLLLKSRTLLPYKINLEKSDFKVRLLFRIRRALVN